VNLSDEQRYQIYGLNQAGCALNTNCLKDWSAQVHNCTRVQAKQRPMRLVAKIGAIVVLWAQAGL